MEVFISTFYGRASIVAYKVGTAVWVTTFIYNAINDRLPDDGLKIYQTYYSKEDEKKYGIVAFELRVIGKY